jgi:hypothetical protein
MICLGANGKKKVDFCLFAAAVLILINPAESGDSKRKNTLFCQ